RVGCVHGGADSPPDAGTARDGPGGPTWAAWVVGRDVAAAAGGAGCRCAAAAQCVAQHDGAAVHAGAGPSTPSAGAACAAGCAGVGAPCGHAAAFAGPAARSTAPSEPSRTSSARRRISGWAGAPGGFPPWTAPLALRVLVTRSNIPAGGI